MLNGKFEKRKAESGLLEVCIVQKLLLTLEE